MKLLSRIAWIFSALVVGASSALAAETMGPVTDDIGVVKIRKGAPMFIGGYWTLSGPDVGLGLDQKRGVELAFDDWNNEVVGHKIRLIAEDSQCNAEGGQIATTKLASNRNIVAVVGPDCSSSATPGRTHPVEGRHRQRRHLHHRTGADRPGPQAGLPWIPAHDL